MVVALAGGVGGAKLADGLQQILGEDLTVVGNVGDDFELWGLHICPDLDTLLYTLGGIANPETGWGVAGDSFVTLEMLAEYGEDAWFRLGDKDLATHILRTQQLRAGSRLTEVTQRFVRALDVPAALLPITDDRLRTIVETDEGTLEFQEYFVRRRWQPAVHSVRFDGAASAELTPEVFRALDEASIVVLCPSNPFVSIEPLLVAGNMRERLAALNKPVIAVSPIVAGDAIKGPTAKVFRELGQEPSATAVARMYADFLTGFVLDERDAEEQPAIEALGLRVATVDTIMNTAADRRRVAEVALGLARESVEAVV